MNEMLNQKYVLRPPEDVHFLLLKTHPPYAALVKFQEAVHGQLKHLECLINEDCVNYAGLFNILEHIRVAYLESKNGQ